MTTQSTIQTLATIRDELAEELDHGRGSSRPDYSTDVELERLERWQEGIAAAEALQADLLAACRNHIDEWHSDSRNFGRDEPRSIKLARAVIGKVPGTSCHKCGAPVPTDLIDATGTDYCEECLAKHLGDVFCRKCKYAGKADTETIQQGGRASRKGPAEPALVALKCPRCHEVRQEVEVWR